MATPEKALSAFAVSASPSANAQALVYDPDESGEANQTRLVSLAIIGQVRVYLVTGDPNGVTTTDGPALGITTDGKLWSRPVATSGNTGWIQLLN